MLLTDGRNTEETVWIGSEGMELEKLEKMARAVQKKLLEMKNRGVDDLSMYQATKAKIESLMVISSKTFPEHYAFFKSVASQLEKLDMYDALETVDHIFEILEIEKVGETKIKEMKIFESAEEKMKQANLSFRKGDYNSSFNNLNTALELVLKEKLRIPLTITKVNTAKIVDILVKYKIEPYLYLSEAKKHITDITNKIKHSGYIPSKSDCIFAIKAMEELISKLRDKEIKLTEEIRNKIYQGL